LRYSLYPYYMKYLHWYAMVERFGPAGYLAYDFGGSSAGMPGIFAFKRGFGGSLCTEYDYDYASHRWWTIAYTRLAYTREHRRLLNAGDATSDSREKA
jgi:lipid II:glycine glycyltransferase (peptidoglycan interpeptide bridge formation enzyme)